MGRKIITWEVILDRFNKAHNYKYDYYEASKVFKPGNLSIPIRCKIHGIFYNTPSSHSNGTGCPKCSNYNNRLVTFTEWKRRARLKHKDFYKYPDTEQEFNKSAVATIICPIHGKFSQLKHNHISSIGCLKCSIIRRTKTTYQFINKASKVHNNLYVYSKVKYINAGRKVSILCKIHGLFYQSPNAHLDGRGCPACANHGFNKEKESILYYVFLPKLNLYKIGITNRTVQERFGKLFKNITVLKEWNHSKGVVSYDIEQEILCEFRNFVYKGPKTEYKGDTEMFIKDVLYFLY